MTEILHVTDIDTLGRAETIHSIGGQAVKVLQRNEGTLWQAVVTQSVPRRGERPVMAFELSDNEQNFAAWMANSSYGLRPYQVRDGLFAEPEQKLAVQEPLREDYFSARDLLTGSPTSGVDVTGDLTNGTITSRLRNGEERWRFEYDAESSLYKCAEPGESRDEGQTRWLADKDISLKSVQQVVKVLKLACFPEKLQE